MPWYIVADPARRNAVSLGGQHRGVRGTGAEGPMVEVRTEDPCEHMRIQPKDARCATESHRLHIQDVDV